MDDVERLRASLPPPSVSALPGHFPKIVSRAATSGMIVWTESSSETPAERELSDRITISSFAVCKDKDSDRLISWPRIQNCLFARPPDIDLPHPGVLSRVHVPEDRAKATKGFEMDVANMFHQLVLPRWRSLLLPLATVAFGDLSGIAQRNLIRQLGLRRRPKQSDRFGPHLRTMPMGFSWAVHVAHEIAASLLRTCISRARAEVAFTGTVLHFSKRSTHIKVRAGDVGVGHIIDDVCMVGFGCPHDFLLASQRHIWSAFSKAGLPIKVSKSTPLGRLLSDKVAFIGFEWHFTTGMIVPKSSRALSAAELQHHSDASFNSLVPKALQTLVGKVIWLCIARRPLLSLLHCSVLPCALIVPSARLTAARELMKFGRLASLVSIDTHRPLSTLVLCTDASPSGGSLVTTRATTCDIEALLERARYNGGALHTCSDAVREFVSTRAWRVVLSYPWARQAHINELEASAILTALRWFALHERLHQRVVLLSDSALVLGALATGRSSALSMLRYTRHIGAFLLARGIDLILVHVPTDVNPADAPSRTLFREGHVLWPSSS